MKTIEIHTPSGTSKIIIGEHLKNLSRYIPEGKSVILTDENILRHYGRDFPSCPVVTIGTGEKNKTMDTLSHIFDRFVELEVDRSTFIIAIGGGIVCDTGGFAASVFMRGLRYGFVSTSLLSQVDASVGGKNGVNFSNYKNMIGLFSQPEFVLCDPSMLMTLDAREYRSGFGEIVKAAAIKSESLFSYIEMHAEEALQMNPDILEKIIYDSVMIKSEVVARDEKEKGERRKLNFGHTFAHAIEHETGMLHGEAVSIGMALEAYLSVQMGYLNLSEYNRLLNLLHRMGLPVNTDIDIKALLNAMKKDKKREGDSIHMIFLDRIGHAVVTKISYNQIENINYDLRNTR